MKIAAAAIRTILIKEDIEGFISVGATMDAYGDEAIQIALALGELESAVIEEQQLLTMVSSIWMKNFQLSSDDISFLLPALRRITHKLLLQIKR